MDSAGMMMYMGQNFTGGPSFLSGLEDVNFQNLANGQIPKYNSTTGKWENGSGSLDIVPKTQAEYDALTPAEKDDPSKIYDIYDANLINADIDDTTTSTGKAWSSSKTAEEIGAVNSNITTKVQTANGTPLKVFWMREKNVSFTSGAGSINLLNYVPAEYQNMSLFNAIVQCTSTSGAVIVSAASYTNGVVNMVLKSVTDGSGTTATVPLNIIFALY